MAEAGDWYLQRIGFSETIYSLPQNGEVWVKRYQPKKKKKNLSENSIFLSSPRVSREHARLTLINNVWHVIDCESVNGVFVNGIRVSKNEVMSVNEGDLVGFGAAEATEQYYYVFKLVKRTNLPTERMNTDLIVKEEPQDDTLSQFSQPDPLRIKTQRKVEEHDETLQATCPNLQVEGHMELEGPDLDETMPLLTEQTENEYDSEIAAVDKNQDPTTSSVLKTNARMHSVQVTNLSPRDAMIQDEQDDLNSSAPPSLQIFGASNTPNRLDGRPTENVPTFGFVSEVRRSTGKVRGRPRRRGRRGICSSRWSPINCLPTERSAQNSARVASETVPSTWNIGCRVTRNVSAKLQSGGLTPTSSSAQSERQTLNCVEEPNSRTEESTSTDIQPSVAQCLHSLSPIESFQSSSNTSIFETATLPIEDSASSELSDQSFTGQHSDTGPVGDDLKRRLLSEVCAVFQGLLSAEPANFDQCLKRLEDLKKNLSEMDMGPNFELNEPIRVVLSNNKCFDTVNSKDQYQITLPVRQTSYPVEIMDSLKQIENVCLGAGAWRDGYGVRLTAEQSEAIKQAKAYALETSVDLLILRGLQKRYNM